MHKGWSGSLVALAIVGAACGGGGGGGGGGGQPAPNPSEPAATGQSGEGLRIAFVYDGAVDDGAYDLATEDGRYLDGIVAGSLTKANVIGYPAGFPIEEVDRGINAFTLGAQSVNPDIKVIPVWINSWYDPPKERQASESLVDAGADILVGEVNSPAMQSVAQKRNVYAIGYGWDSSARSPDVWLSSFTFVWGPYYLAEATAILDGSWKPQLFYGGLRDGGIGLSTFGPAVPQTVIDLVQQKKDEIASGTLDFFA